jgi:hypothetical protein
MKDVLPVDRNVQSNQGFSFKKVNFKVKSYIQSNVKKQTTDNLFKNKQQLINTQFFSYIIRNVYNSSAGAEQPPKYNNNILIK